MNSLLNWTSILSLSSNGINTRQLSNHVPIELWKSKKILDSQSMTIIFGLTQKCLNFLGLLFVRQESVGLRVRRCISITMMCSLLQPMVFGFIHTFFKRDVSYYIQVICICIIQLSFFFEHRYDVIKATEVLIQVSAEIMTISKVAFFFYNRKHALEIIENLQSNFNESKNVPYI